MDYCHNCHHFERLNVHWCQWCLDFFYSRGRMPKPGDGARTTLGKMYAAMGWELTPRMVTA